MMRIKKILNNNIALVDKGGHESIIYSTGIAFRKKAGQQVEDSEIEKTYVLDSKDRLEHFSYLLSHTKEQTISLINEIVAYAEELLQQKANDYLYLVLLDHINFTFKRAQKGQFIKSPLEWEVQKFYPKHYQAALYALNRMKKYYEIEFPEDEAVAIALHFINMEQNEAYLNEKIADMETLTDFLNILRYHFKLTFDEKSINYLRLLTHLQFFIERLHKNITYQDESELFDQIKAIYPEAYAAAEKIEIYVKGKFNQYLSKDEYSYLMIHINRLVNRKEEEK